MLPEEFRIGLRKYNTTLLTEVEAERERGRIGWLRDLFLEELRKLSWPMFLNGSATSRHPGNANIRFEGFFAEDLLTLLQPRLAASTASACTSGFAEPSHVLRAIGLTDSQMASSIRFCIGRYTTETDIHEAVALIAEGLGQMSLEELREA